MSEFFLYVYKPNTSKCVEILIRFCGSNEFKNKSETQNLNPNLLHSIFILLKMKTTVRIFSPWPFWKSAYLYWNICLMLNSLNLLEILRPLFLSIHFYRDILFSTKLRERRRDCSLSSGTICEFTKKLKKIGRW